MIDDHATRTPMHLWIVGMLATLWNAFGAYDYLMTRSRNTEYLASMMPDSDPQAVLAWVDAFPLYAQFGWGLGVWGALAGSILLLLKSRWAVTAYILSLIGMALGLGYQLFSAPPIPGAEGAMADIMSWVIIVAGLLLLYYTIHMKKKGVLR